MARWKGLACLFAHGLRGARDLEVSSVPHSCVQRSLLLPAPISHPSYENRRCHRAGVPLKSSCWRDNGGSHMRFRRKSNDAGMQRHFLAVARSHDTLNGRYNGALDIILCHSFDEWQVLKWAV